MKSGKSTVARRCRACIMLAMCAVVSGCDDLLNEKRDQQRLDVERRASEERSRIETESRRTAMIAYAKGKRELLVGKRADIAKKVDALKADSSRLAEIVDVALEEKDSKGRDRKYESKLLGMLRDEDVNALAVKYLNLDFKGITAEYIARVRDAMKAEAEFEKAISETDANYKNDIEEAQRWSNMTHQQRDSEINRLKKELVELESQRDVARGKYEGLTRGKLVGSARHEEERREAKQVASMKVDELDRQIDRKRRQLDLLTSPDSQRSMSGRAMISAQTSQSRAESIRRNALADIDRRLKPKKSVTDVVAEFDGQTVGKLRETLAERITALTMEMEAIDGNISIIDEILLSIPVSNMSDLNRSKQRLENMKQ